MSVREDVLAARIALRAVLPVIKVMLEEDPKLGDKFRDVRAVVQFDADDSEFPMAAHIVLDHGAFSLVPEKAENPDLVFSFPSLRAMNAFFAGRPALPRLLPLLKGAFTRFGLFLKVLGILLGLKLLMPDAKPKSPLQARLKVKMTLYMVSTALSQLNKAGDPEMKEWTSRQPERVYQWSVDGTDIACYLRVKAGNTQAGRGICTRRRPFVHMRFRSIEDALPLLANEVDLVDAMGRGMVVNDGSPEYGAKVGDFMQKIAKLLT